MNFAISDIEAAIGGWRMRSPSDEAFAASAEARALARLYGAVIVHGCGSITDASLDDAQRDALRILSPHPPGEFPAMNADAADTNDDSQRKWRASGDFALLHPSGWTIARYSVHDEWRYLLWEPVDRCTATRSNQFHGPFENVRDAMRLQRELTAHLQQPEMAA